MSGKSEFEIRPLMQSDIPAAMRIKTLAHWNQTERDWWRLLELEPHGCFAAWRVDRLVGTATTTTYGKDLAWIGMVLVDPEYRRRGIATQLMRAALNYLRDAGVAVVKLDATSAGQPVYEKLGFVVEGLIERWESRARLVQRAQIPVWDKRTISEVHQIDRAAFGADRSRLIDLLVADACAAPIALADPDGRLRGYALARRGANAAYIGPVIAADEGSALVLLDGTMCQLSGEKVFIDFHPEFPIDISRLSARGFTKQRDLIRMRLGGKDGSTSPLVFAVAGLEVG
jgi:GNAT superfamily N-acetyltransferase